MGLEATPVIPQVREALGDKVIETHAHAGDETVVVPRESWVEALRTLRDRPELAFNFLMDLTAVDYFGRDPRFEIVAHLYSLAHNRRLRVKTRVPDADPSVDSLTPLWRAADWLEREAWDMLGIIFHGHPDLRRILLYEEFVGHPLRKDYPVNKRQPLVPERDPIEKGWRPG